MYGRYGKRKFAPKRKYAKRPTKMPRKSTAVSMATKKYVNRMIHKNIENKALQYDFTNNYALGVASAGQAAFALDLMPNTLLRGVNQDQRIGNEIHVTSSTIRGQVNILPYNATTNNLAGVPIVVQMFLVKVKSGFYTQQNTAIVSIGSIPCISTTKFFQYGGTTSGFTNSVQDLFMNVNTDLFTVLQRKKMTIGCASQTGVGGVVTSAVQAPFKKDFSFNLTKHYKIGRAHV